jgi:hypothetical protein
MFILVTSYYLSGNLERQKELDECLIRNSKNEFITSIFLLNDKIHDINFIESEYRHKIIQLVVNNDNKKRLYFNYAIRFINEYLFGERCILSNSDIYFDDTLKHLISKDMTNTMIALSRYDGEEVMGIYSQDSWMFKSPLNIDLEKVNFQFGILGCDNVFANVVSVSGYNVVNPCKTIISHHLHNSGYRTYSLRDQLKGNYTLVIQSSC